MSVGEDENGDPIPADPVYGALLAALADALDGMEDMIGYVPEYFQEKWDHQAYITRARTALEVARSGPLTRRPRTG
jgi:hypothetical protein